MIQDNTKVEKNLGLEIFHKFKRVAEQYVPVKTAIQEKNTISKNERVFVAFSPFTLNIYRP